MPNRNQSSKTMSPEAFAPFDGFPGVAAAARDANFKLLWCNDQMCAVHGKTRQAMLGTGLDSLFPKELAEERMGLMRPVLENGKSVSYFQFTHGYRWLTRVWSLDQAAFGVPGVFIVLQQASQRAADVGEPSRPLPLARLGDLGELAILTARELEVYYHLAVGLTVNDIGEMLHRSPKTIERHLESLHRKMQFNNRAALVRSAVERGVVGFTPAEWQQFIDQRREAS